MHVYGRRCNTVIVLVCFTFVAPSINQSINHGSVFLGAACGSPYIVFITRFCCMASCYRNIIYIYIYIYNVWCCGGTITYTCIYIASTSESTYCVATFILTPFSNLAQRRILRKGWHTGRRWLSWRPSCVPTWAFFVLLSEICLLLEQEWAQVHYPDQCAGRYVLWRH